MGVSVIGGGLQEGAGSLDGADDGSGLHGLDAVDGAEAVRDIVVEVGVVVAADGQQEVGGAGCGRFTTFVTDLDRVSDLLTRNSVPFQAVGARLVVGAADACGCAVLFEA